MVDPNSKLRQWIAYKIMVMVMNIRKKFRNIQSEISFPGPRPSDIVLDYGCGPGFNTIPLARDVVIQGKVYALDNNPNAIKDVLRRAKRFNLNNIEIIPSGYPEVIDDGIIDIVILHNVLPYIKDKEIVLAEIRRILKPEGRLSYISKKMAHAVGNRKTGEIAMTDEELSRHLKTKYKSELIKKENGHLVFEKQKD